MPTINVALDTDAAHLPTREDQDRMIDELIADKDGDAREVIRELLVLQGHLVSQMFSGVPPSLEPGA